MNVTKIWRQITKKFYYSLPLSLSLKRMNTHSLFDEQMEGETSKLLL